MSFLIEWQFAIDKKKYAVENNVHDAKHHERSLDIVRKHGNNGLHGVETDQPPISAKNNERDNEE
jgi:hypothetical protein